MAISAIDNNQSFLSRIVPFKSKNVAASTQNKISNADGDTLKLSGNTPNVAPKTTVYAAPKPVVSSSDPTLKTTNGSSADTHLKKLPAAVK